MNVPNEGQAALNFVTVRVNQHNWKWYLALGIVLILGGGVAIIFPLGVSLGVELFVGIILIVTGAAFMAHAIGARAHGFVLQLLLAVLYLALGVMLLVNPAAGVITLTLLLGLGFLVAGAFKFLFALVSRAMNGWAMLMVSGLLGMLVGLFILESWPDSSAWVIGLLVGIDLLFTGMTMVTLAVDARNSSRVMTA